MSAFAGRHAFVENPSGKDVCYEVIGWEVLPDGTVGTLLRCCRFPVS